MIVRQVMHRQSNFGSFRKKGNWTKLLCYLSYSEEKGNQKEQFRMPKERINKYFAPGTPVKQMEDTIVQALEIYRKKERSKEKDRER